jgi:hypothetical protein
VRGAEAVTPFIIACVTEAVVIAALWKLLNNRRGA